jgi:hypothetical protein
MAKQTTRSKMRNKLALAALIVALLISAVAAGLLEAAGARGRVLWQEKCPVLGGEVLVEQVGSVYLVQCHIGD